MTDGTYTHIGKRVPFIDARDKVTGATVYGMDINLPGMLYAKVLRSPHAHARIVHIDTDKAKHAQGVRAVVTSADAPDVLFGPSKMDERFFARDEVLYMGHEVAAVVAVNEEAAAEALHLIDVTYEPLPVVLDPVEAIKPGALTARMDTENNIAHHSEVTRGNVEEGFHQSAAIVEGDFYTGHHYFSYIEPQAAAAQWKNGRLTIWASHQSANLVELVICSAFNLPRGSFQFIQMAVGGGFGGKTHMRVVPLAALLAKVAGAPVLLTLTREEDFTAACTSVPMHIHIKMGANADGIITTKEARFIGDNGAYTADALGVIEIALTRVDNLYRYRNVHNVGDLVYTNKVGTTAFRGFGNQQINFATEQLVDMLAQKLGIDAAEFRLRNATCAGDVTIHGGIIDSSGLQDAIRAAVSHSGWSGKRGQRTRKGSKVRGIGLACGIHGSGAANLKPSGASALVRIHEGGTVHVATGEGDIGQGNNTVYALIVAEELGVSLGNVVVDQLDTDITNFGIGATSSRGVVIGGGGVRAAAIAVRQRLIDCAAKKWNCIPDKVQFSRGIFINPLTEESIKLADLAAYYADTNGGSRVLGEAIYNPAGVVDPGESKFGNSTLGFGFGAHVAEVEVDLETGQVDVLHYVAVHDAGQVINLIGAEGQVEGAVLQGIGFALTEEYIFNNGQVLNTDFTQYRIPTALDAPPIDVFFTDTIEPKTVFGAKSIGEVSMVPVAPAIANAIADAIGMHLSSLPMTPERIFTALKQSRQGIGTQATSPLLMALSPTTINTCKKVRDCPCYSVRPSFAKGSKH